jgi:serine/threonine protein kinase
MTYPSLPIRIGRYEVVRRLGAGGMAETFVAVARGPHDFEQRVCIKCVLPAYLDNERFVSLFMEEARITASLRHANIVHVVDFGEDPDSHALYLALELIEGIDLHGLLRGQPERTLPHDLVTLLASDLALALDSAHTHVHTDSSNHTRHGVVHRDISPSNVLVSFAGEIKLTDFGIAKEVRPGELTRTTSLKGKLSYMSPEQIRNDQLDGRSDLFAFGVLLFECLAGFKPFRADNDIQLLKNIIEGNRPALSHVCPPDTPPVLIEAVESLLVTDVHARCQSAADFLEALRPISPAAATRKDLALLVKAATQAREQLAQRQQAKTTPANLAHVPNPASKPEPAQSASTAPTRTAAAPPPPNDPHNESGRVTTDGTVFRDPSKSVTYRVPTGETHPPRGEDGTSKPRIGATRHTGLVLGVMVGVMVVVAVVFAIVGALNWKGARPSRPSTAVTLITTSGKSSATAPTAPHRPKVPVLPPPIPPASPAPPTLPAPNNTTAAAEPNPTAPAKEGQAEQAEQATAAATTEAASPAPKQPDIPAKLPKRQANTHGESAEPSTAPAGGALLTVESEPRALIFVDGRAVGKTPKTLRLKPGAHRVHVGRDASSAVYLNLRPGQKEKVVLTPK